MLLLTFLLKLLQKRNKVNYNHFKDRIDSSIRSFFILNNRSRPLTAEGFTSEVIGSDHLTSDHLGIKIQSRFFAIQFNYCKIGSPKK